MLALRGTPVSVDGKEGRPLYRVDVHDGVTFLSSTVSEETRALLAHAWVKGADYAVPEVKLPVNPHPDGWHRWDSMSMLDGSRGWEHCVYCPAERDPYTGRVYPRGLNAERANQ